MDMLLVDEVDGTNPTLHDLKIELGNFVFISDVQAEVAQNLRIRLNFFKGEWFLDQREGLPYYQEILVKNPTDETIRGVFTNALLTCPGVVGVNYLRFDLDGATRLLSLEFEVVLTDGSALSSADFAPFIVEF